MIIIMTKIIITTIMIIIVTIIMLIDITVSSVPSERITAAKYKEK